ncbi:hypothetical protein LZ012_11525 [Dechloromonas sp. XY25]|uniref:AsmA-like C-terminal domain-containing protein n=1 Tax=Dechloromonas hankyongensis TaxID=2908002 RepID=A0ABS9K386_9RHOO|nr:AsmA-like C-terminal region-containing protein [Dechloromonas hankyongensis]MCG2577623.1 hypothetical protein [Dechloromonas hankyongensis]
MVEAALRELEEGGYIAPQVGGTPVWQDSRQGAETGQQSEPPQPMSQFSVFGPQTGAPNSQVRAGAASGFPSLGKPSLSPRGRAGESGFKPSMAPQPYQRTVPEHVAGNADAGRWRLRRRHLALGLGGIMLLGVAIALLYPYDRFKPAFETSASQYIGAPVKIGAIGMALLPMPHFRLSNLSIGASGEGRVAEVRIASPWALLGGKPLQISRIDVTGVQLMASQLVAMPFFKVDGPVSGVALVRKLHFEHSRLVFGEGAEFPDIYGQLDFQADGKLDKATIESDDRTMLVEARPGPLGIALNIEGRAWKPAGTTAQFASLQAKGILQKDKLLVQNIDTTFLGGVLRGDWLLDWGHGLAMAGDATLSRIDTRKLGAAFAPSLKLEGEMSGTVKLRSSAANWEALWRNAEVVLNTEITRGTLYGVDLGEAARRNGVSEVRAGVTKFDRLRSTISINPRQIALKDVRMDAGMVTAAGQFVAGRDGQVDGNMAVTLQTSVAKMNVPVHVYGSLPDLIAVGQR